MVEDIRLSKAGDIIELGDVECNAGTFVLTVLLDKGIEVLLAATDGNDEGAVLNHLLSQRLSDARGGADNEDCLVWERHVDDRVVRVVEVESAWSLEFGVESV